MTIIDLGEVSATDFEPPRPPALVPGRLVRPIVLAVVTLLTLVTVTASALPRGPTGVRPLWSAPLGDSDTVFLSGDTVYLNRMNESQDRATLTAYEAATGAVRWTADAGSVGGYPDQVTAGGVVLQSVAYTEYRTGETTMAFTRTTVALDNATGARLWQRDASSVQVVGDTVLMSEHDAKGRVTRLRMVRQRDGGTIWTRALAANGAVAASDDAVVTIDDHGAVTVLAWADGSVRRTGTVPWTPQRLQDGLHNDVSVVGDDLIVSRSDDRSDQPNTHTIVYRLDTLAEAWRGDGYIGDCDAVLCSSERDNAVGRDPVTGAERWRRPGLAQAFPIGADRLVANPLDNSGMQLLDAATGRTVADLGPGELPWAGELRGPLLVLRNELDVPPLHTTVIRVDRKTGEQFTLGAVPFRGGGNPSCQAGPHYLACPGDDRIYVTAVG